MDILTRKNCSEKKLIEKAREVLANDGLVVVPSDTVYGLSVDATNQGAIEKLIEFKERPKGRAISVFMGDLENAKKYVELSTEQETTINTLTPGPYTFVVPSNHTLRQELESEKGTLGIRIPDFPFANRLTIEFGNPITATSANLSSQSPHYSIESFLNSLSEKKKKLVDLVIDFGKLPRNKPSTVVDLTEDSLKVLRQGDATVASKSISLSESSTKKIAHDLISQLEKESNGKPVVLILQGDLGTGKTVFVKGIGEKLGIDNIISPTYIVCYEYKTVNKLFMMLHHCDFYILSETDELHHLGLDKMLTKGSLICIEWGEKSASLIGEFKKKAEVYTIEISHIDENKREIIISKL